MAWSAPGWTRYRRSREPEEQASVPSLASAGADAGIVERLQLGFHGAEFLLISIQMTLGGGSIPEPRIHEAELIVDFRRPRIGGGGGEQRIARLGVALLRHPHHADHQIGAGVRRIGGE